MNECMGIVHDKDIRDVRTKVSSKVLRKFNTGKKLEADERPRGKPMLLDYDGGSGSAWNREVWEAFKPFLLEREAKLNENHLPFPDEDTARDIFMSRIDRLRRYFNETKPRELDSGRKETIEEVKQRIKETDEFNRDLSRDNTRRSEVTVSLFPFISLVFFSILTGVNRLGARGWRSQPRTCTTQTVPPMTLGNGCLWLWILSGEMVRVQMSPNPKTNG